MEKGSSLLAIDKPIRIHLMGDFRVYGTAGDEITPVATKARCLLVVLILENGGTVSREKMSQLLWSRHAHEQARASLRQSLSVLRRTLNGISPGFISADRKNIYIQLDKAWVDTQHIADEASDREGPLAEANEGLLEDLNANDPEFENWLGLKKQALQEKITKHTSAAVDQGAFNNVHRLKPSSSPQIPASILQKNESHDNSTTVAIKRNSAVIKKVSDQSPYRMSLLKKVKEFWIDGLLEHSLVKGITIELALKEEPGYLYQPWESIVPQPNKRTQFFPANTKIVDVFEELNESMLILGSPGSGKTTLLLNLAKKLVALSEGNINAPTPVVLHLSTWSDKYTDFRDWLIDELEDRYQMPRKLSAGNVDDNNLLLLLDGLDEVDANDQVGCVQAINKFQNQSMPVPMVVCSRDSDYSELFKKESSQLALAGAVVIQPIDVKQLDGYLGVIDRPEQGLNTAINDNNKIKELLTTPLMLSIATTAYENYHKNDCVKSTPNNTVKDQLFSSYVEAMFQRRKQTEEYSSEQTMRWLGCLARTLIEKKQSLFYLDGMQPDWAETALQRWIVSIGSIYMCGSLVVLVLSLLGGQFLDVSSSLPLVVALGIVGCYLTGRLGHGDRIRPVSRIRLSLSILRDKLYFKLFSSTALGVIFGAGITVLLNVTIGITAGLFFFLLLMISNALDFELAKGNQPQPSAPNEAIRESLKNSLVGLVLGAMLGATVGLLVNGLQGAIFMSAMLGVISGLFFGGHACMQHYLLRYFLWRSKTAPFRYIPFLEFSVDRVFLYRVGGGYLFIHRSLAEYFAKKL